MRFTRGLAGLTLVPVFAGITSTAVASGDTDPTCRTSQLTISLHGIPGGADHEGVVIRFRNNGQACTLRGYPGVDGATQSGRVVVHARRTPSGYLGGPGRTATVHLPTARTASALLEGLGGQMRGGPPCHHYQDLIITPPRNQRRVIRPDGNGVCYPQIHPVTSGRNGGANAPR